MSVKPSGVCLLVPNKPFDVTREPVKKPAKKLCFMFRVISLERRRKGKKIRSQEIGSIYSNIYKIKFKQ